MLFSQAGPPPTSGVPLGLILAVSVGLVLLGLLIWGVKNPLAWVIVAAVAVAVGVGAVAIGTTHAVMLGEQRTARQVEEASYLFGGGAGGVAGGAVLLAVALLRYRRGTETTSVPTDRIQLRR